MKIEVVLKTLIVAIFGPLDVVFRAP